MTKAKLGARPPKKSRSKVIARETVDDFQEAADREEETGGKWRAGDAAKAGRAFARALDIYEHGLAKHPADFDLAYNKARLQLEITQQTALVEQSAVPLIELLSQTMESHRYALKLKDDYPDLLFNTAQTLTSLAEHLSEAGCMAQATSHLQEALELLAACLSRQEMLLEQQRVDFNNFEDGGVALDAGEKPASSNSSDIVEQTAVIEVPVSPSDLLDTVHASLAALTTLVPLIEMTGLQTLGDMAESITETKAPLYLDQLAPDLKQSASLRLSIDRAIFVAEYVDAQYNLDLIEFRTYLERLNATFDINSKMESARALRIEAQARSELVLSALDRLEGNEFSSVVVYWNQLALAQELYSKATKLDDDEARELKAQIYKLKGELELLRFRLASMPNTDLDATARGSAQTLLANAVVFSKGAALLAANDGDDVLENAAKLRWLLAAEVGLLLFNISPTSLPSDPQPGAIRTNLVDLISSFVDEGLLELQLGNRLMQNLNQG